MKTIIQLEMNIFHGYKRIYAVTCMDLSQMSMKLLRLL